MAVVVSHRSGLDGFAIPGIPEFNPMMLLHGEESVEIMQPIEPESTVRVQETLIDVQDKGKATVLIVQADAFDIESNELIFRTTSSLFIRGIGGFGNKGTVKIKIPKAPKRPADNTSEELTQPN